MAYPTKGVDPALNPTLAEIERISGPNNSLRVMAHRPDAMYEFTRLYAALMGPASLLDRRLKEIVYLAISHVNECDYGVAHHSKAALTAGISETEIHNIEIEKDEDFSPRERAALHYARDLTRTAVVDDETRYETQERFSTDEFVELTMIVGLANFTNRFNNGVAVALDVSRSMG